MEPTFGDYDVSDVEGIDALRQRIEATNSIEDWSYILQDYISFGNTKIDKSVAIFNLNAATDCPNAKSEKCQVPFEKCYAHKAENIYPNTLDYRRRQEYLWDHISAETFARAFLLMVERKRNDVSTIRFSESGDFRNNNDIKKVDTIAKIVGKAGIDVYTYSASSDLEWSNSEHFKVMQSNNLRDYGDALYKAVPEVSDIPDDGVQCPYDATGGKVKCGECKLCIDQEIDKDVYITLH